MDITRSSAHGHADHGWLSSHHTFSFGHYYNPDQIGFSDIRVINDDRVVPGKGFGEHSHRDMEIFSYVLEGALEHKDTMGTGSIIRPGDVQMMSAGSGVAHSEYNPSRTESVRFLQIWVIPSELGAKPRYQQNHYSENEKRGRLRLIISPDGAVNSLQIRQDVRIYAGMFNGNEAATFTLSENRYAYIHIARGQINVNGESLDEGDGAKIRDKQLLNFTNGKNCELLFFDLRPIEYPKQT